MDGTCCISDWHTLYLWMAPHFQQSASSAGVQALWGKLSLYLVECSITSTQSLPLYVVALCADCDWSVLTSLDHCMQVPVLQNSVVEVLCRRGRVEFFITNPPICMQMGWKDGIPTILPYQ